MRSLVVAAFCFAAACCASATGLNAADGQQRELAYDDMDTLFKDVRERPEWFGFSNSSSSVAEVEGEEVMAVGAKAGAYAYTYSQTSGRFSGPGFDGSSISITGCSGQKGECRNNPACQCKKSVGPLPQGGYKLSSMMTFKGMPYCYVLTQTSGNACGRSGFLIHGGSCSANPSEGCIVIPDQNVRYKIKGGGSLTVTK